MPEDPPAAAAASRSTSSIFPTFSAPGGINMANIGITRSMYTKLQFVAEKNNCVIMIRRTNTGSVMPFQNRTAVGKKLATKGKSSSALFTKGNITFLAEMAKSLDPSKWLHEQCALISMLGETTGGGSSGSPVAKYRYVPKLVTEQEVAELKKTMGTTWHKDGEGDYRVEHHEDRIGDSSPTHTWYRLVKTSWNVARNLGADCELAAPAADLGDEATVYRVYISMIPRPRPDTSTPEPDNAEFPLIRGDFIQPVTQSVDAGAFPPASAPTGAAQVVEHPTFVDVTTRRLWEQYSGFEKVQQRSQIDEALRNDLQHCAPRLAPSSPFREVRVLAIRTRRWEEAAETGGHRRTGSYQFFEIVADYDLFMVAPRLDALDENGCMPGPGRPRSVVPVLGGPLRRKTGRKNPYGLLSEFELHVRNEINAALGTKAVQHGAEVANLFHTSDLRDPVIAIYPPSAETAFAPPVTGPDLGDLVSSGPCFFLSTEMLFDMVSNREIRRAVPFAELNGTFGHVDDYVATPDGLASRYGLPLNLNWGTDSYRSAAGPTADVQLRELETTVLGADAEDRSTLVEGINEFFDGSLPYGSQEFSIRMLMVFLYRGWRRYRPAAVLRTAVHLGAHARTLGRGAAPAADAGATALLPDIGTGRRSGAQAPTPRQRPAAEGGTTALPPLSGTGRGSNVVQVGGGHPAGAPASTTPAAPSRKDDSMRHLRFLRDYYAGVRAAVEVDSQGRRDLVTTYETAVKAVDAVLRKVGGAPDPSTTGSTATRSSAGAGRR